MITAIVRFRLPEGTTRDDAKAMFEKSAPNYRGVPGLVICTERIELEEAFISGIAVRPPNGSIRRRGEPRSRSDMVRSRKFHFTILRSLSRMWMKKTPAPPENCQV